MQLGARPKKILAMKLRALGDTVLMTAPLAELRRTFPEAEIHAAVTAPWAPLLADHPAIDQIWKYERHEERAARAKSVARLAFNLRRERFDCVVNFHASPSSATIAFATGARVRSVHFHGHKDRNRHSTVIVPGKGTLKPVIERDMDAVRALGVEIPAGRLPKIILRESERKDARDWLTRKGFAARPLMIIGLAASRPTKTWPLDRFAKLAQDWIIQRNGSVLAVAGPDEANHILGFLKAIDAICPAEMRQWIAAENTLGLRQLAALLSQAAVFTGNDSGPKHIAISVGTPTVTIFGPEHPFEWHPYPVDRHPYLFIDPLPCRKDADPGMPAWCGLHECTQQYQHQCMTGISTKQVLDQCLRVAAQ